MTEAEARQAWKDIPPECLLEMAKAAPPVAQLIPVGADWFAIEHRSGSAVATAKGRTVFVAGFYPAKTEVHASLEPLDVLITRLESLGYLIEGKP